jgi:hypothetical protein
MKVQAVPPRATDGPRPREVTLVWIDTREAIVVRWVDAEPVSERIESDVPAHHRATGHVRHDPSGCHGGGPPRAAGEQHRLEHLARFLDTVADVLPDEDDLLLLGPGTVHEHLARLIRKRDGLNPRKRSIAVESATRKTRGQLVAYLRRARGEEPRRRTVGAYRWSPTPASAPPGTEPVWPRRISEKGAPRPTSKRRQG